MLQQITKSGKVTKTVFIVRRCEIVKGEHAGRVINVVRSVKVVKGELVTSEYQVISFEDGRVTCNCEARTPHCCHRDEVEFAEMRNTHKLQPEVTAQPSVETTVNAELVRVGAMAATPEEIAATQAKLLRPNDVDQIAYFLQMNRRSAAIKSVPTPTPRNVSTDWLLGNRNSGTFSGKVA